MATSDSGAPKEMRAAVVKSAGAALVVEKIPVPELLPNQVLIKVAACGVCHSDAMMKYNHLPGIVYPIVPGHEVAGTIVKIGSAVKQWKVGQPAGAGWHGGHCHSCNACRKGIFVCCSEAKVTGAHVNGGYAEYMVLNSNALVAIPDGMQPEVAAPLMCAGVTVFNSLRNVHNTSPGDLVAVQALGGLGQLGIQFAKHMGFRVAAISTSDEKRSLALSLGADHFINSKTQDAAAELQKLGGARVVLATVPNGPSMASVLGGIGLDGTLVVLGADVQPIPVPPLALIMKRISVKGWPSGSPIDTEETLRFAAQRNIKSPVEVRGLADADAALEATHQGKSKTRIVLKP